MGGFTISHNEKPQLVSYNEYRVNVYACHFSSTNCPCVIQTNTPLLR